MLLLLLLLLLLQSEEKYIKSLSGIKCEELASTSSTPTTSTTAATSTTTTTPTTTTTSTAPSTSTTAACITSISPTASCTAPHVVPNVGITGRVMKVACSYHHHEGVRFDPTHGTRPTCAAVCHTNRGSSLS